MDTKAIRVLAEMMKANDLTQIEITEAGKTIRLERKGAFLSEMASAVDEKISSVCKQENSWEGSEPLPDAKQPQTLITSPMVGVYFEAPAPDAKPFVQIGSKVKVGDVLCIIEAMKTMNEITAEQEGEIVEIYTGNGQLVEVGQRLFHLREEA